MAKQSASPNGVNKSQLVRDVLAGDPHSKVKDVVGTLAAKGIRVQPSLVYALKSKIQAKKQRRIRQGVTRVTGNSDPVALIIKVREFATLAGGMKKLKALVDVMAE